ncbi:hypothetical protein HispidOSU_030618 [Sigmodon hispidus]
MAVVSQTKTPSSSLPLPCSGTLGRGLSLVQRTQPAFREWQIRLAISGKAIDPPHVKYVQFLSSGFAGNHVSLYR